MKMLKIWSLAAMLLMTMVACNNKNHGGPSDSGSLDKIEQDWEAKNVSNTRLMKFGKYFLASLYSISELLNFWISFNI